MDIKEKIAASLLKRKEGKAVILLADNDKALRFLKSCEKKVTRASALKMIPQLLGMSKSYIKGEYREIPLGSIVAVVAALLYFVSPLDALMDYIPVLGYLDDAAVVAVCVNMVRFDMDEYLRWKKMHQE